LITLGYASRLGRTDSHLMLVDLRKKNITGRMRAVARPGGDHGEQEQTIPGDRSRRS